MELHANGARLHCERSGSGPPLILLHGNGEDHHIFDALAPELARRATVYAVDSRGHGASEPAAELSYDLLCEDLRALIEALGLARPALIGFSDGAIAALLLALRHSETAGPMALLGVNLSPEDFDERCRAEMEREYEQTGNPLIRMMLEQPQIPLEALAGLSGRVLLAFGEHDLFRPALPGELARTIPDCELHILPGCDHSSYLAGNAGLRPLLTRFFGLDA